jgi:trigger factor
LKVTVEKPQSYQRVLKIEVPPEAIGEEIENLYSKVQATATHPGFRKGKVPRRILERKHGKSIRLEAVENTVSSSLKRALEDEHIVPLTDPDFGEVKYEDESGPLSFEVTVEVEPEIELGPYKGIELKKPKPTVTDADIERVIHRLQLSNAKYIPVERPVEKGDIVIIDFESFSEGKPLKAGKAESFPLEVGSNAFGEEFENQLVGMGLNEEKRISIRYPEDYRAKDLAGKEVTFVVKMKDIKLRELPEVNDEFAKDVGYADMEELKTRVRENLVKDLEKRIEHFLREQALSKVVADSKLEIPPKLKSRVAAAIFEEEVRRMAEQGADREAITERRDKIVEYADVEAERRLKINFVSDEISRRENFEVSEEELNKSIEETIAEAESSDPRIRNYFSSERVRSRYKEQLRVGKILDFIVNNAKIEEVDQPETSPAGGEAESDQPASTEPEPASEKTSDKQEGEE